MVQNNINLAKHNIQTWLVDFDETLAVGTLTWVLKYTFPKFIIDHQLAYDETRLEKVMVTLQERSRQNPDSALLLTSLFEMMEWPQSLQAEFMADIGSNYRPSLFDDTLPFLQHMKAGKRRVYVVSNNKHTPLNMQMLQLDEYVTGVFTPKTSPGTQPKPHASLWEFITTQNVDIDPHTTGVIGDDPWTDGAFAENCGLPCWIVDRTKRLSELYSQKPYNWVQSLLDIPS